MLMTLCVCIYSARTNDCAARQMYFESHVPPLHVIGERGGFQWAPRDSTTLRTFPAKNGRRKNPTI